MKGEVQFNFKKPEIQTRKDLGNHFVCTTSFKLNTLINSVSWGRFRNK
ncbi:hypothetical protein X953_14795 [Virgibacillus sp. SK37]|nr:hypothetical protein X953_14795 [Virgibacillus sp. SK37]